MYNKLKNKKEEFNLDKEIQQLQQELKILQKQSKQNTKSFDMRDSGYKNIPMINTFIKFMINQQKWNHKIKEQIDKNREESLLYTNDEIRQTKNIFMAKMELFEALDQKIDKKNRQIEQNLRNQILQMDKIHCISYEKMAHKNEKELQALKEEINGLCNQVEYIKDQIQNSHNEARIFEDTSLLESPEKKRCVFINKSFQKKCGWFLFFPVLQQRIARDGDRITASENSVRIFGCCAYQKNSCPMIKIERKRGQIDFLTNNENFLNDNFGPNELNKLNEGEIFYLNPNKSKSSSIMRNRIMLNFEETKFIETYQNLRKVNFSIYFEKMGDSLSFMMK